ncbi:hypothetical protein ACO0K9_27300 [Undibacterium sp. Ji50W]|uniref:hypothetical protein n=1 Tax=Undibacterium sp. Ji50W TaxID=3413041 RepID=UPI003BF40205
MFEFGLKTTVSRDQIGEFLANYFNLSEKSIVDKISYWEINQDAGTPLIGFSVENSETGFKTIVSGQTNFHLFGEHLGKLAAHAASFFNTDIIIGDYRAEGEGANDRLLVFFANGSIGEAIDNSCDGFNDVEILSYIEM